MKTDFKKAKVTVEKRCHGKQPTIFIVENGRLYMITNTPDGDFNVTDEGFVGERYDIEAVVRCTNCGNKYPEKEVIYDGDEDMEFCPYCGEGGCIVETINDLNTESQQKYNEQVGNCNYIIEKATELRALFSYKSNSMMNYNFPRALADVEAIKSALAEVEEFVKSFK